jgi:dTDP-4-dehydrorhamnose reductase
MASSSALIGYTGFVGGNLHAQHEFTDGYNTKNIADLDGRSYDLIVSAATPAEVWRANQDPAGDLASIDALIAHLRQVRAKQFVLISTILVYARPVGVDEDSDPDTAQATAYGANRSHLEAFCREHFDDLLIVRLPGLFGAGLKKNVIYDLLHDNQVDKIDSRGVFQYYNLDRIWSDIQTALDHGLQSLNLAVEPVTNAQVAQAAFGLDFEQHILPDDRIPHFDMYTKHAALFGQSGHYVAGRDEVLADIAAFVARERAAA